MNKRETKIKITGIQHDISEEAIENLYDGSYTLINGTHFISYTEKFEDDNKNIAANKNLIKITDNSVEMVKKGVINSEMKFSTKEKHSTNYATPYGTFLMDINTHHLSTTVEENKIEVDIKYHLSMDNQPLSKCTINIQILF